MQTQFTENQIETKSFKSLKSYKNHEIFKDVLDVNHFLIACENGLIKISSFLNGITRISVAVGKNAHFLNIPSFSVIENAQNCDFVVKETERELELSNAALTFTLNKADSNFTLHDKVTSTQKLKFSIQYDADEIRATYSCIDSSRFYGLGEKTGFLDKRGRKYRMWNTDEFDHNPLRDPLYKSIPLLIQSDAEKSFALFVDNPGDSSFDLDSSLTNTVSFSVKDTELNFYYIPGSELSSVVKNYASLTGKMELPPLWSLGYQQCRYSYYPDTEVIRIAKELRERQIPCDVIYLDIHYMDGYRVFTWDKDNFSDPEALLKELHEMGFKVVTIVDPGVKIDSEYPVYIEGLKADAFCKLPNGQIYEGEVWPGAAVYPDFSKKAARDYWGKCHSELLGKGVDGIWNDMNEPSDFSQGIKGDKTLRTVPANVIMNNDGHERTFAKYHNIYGQAMCKATKDCFEDHKKNERPFIVTRSAYAGIQRYAAVWTGDNCAYWEHMRMSIAQFCNLGLSGCAFVGGDVGGFQGDTSPELFARWMQLGAFTPFFRSHTAIDTKAHEPWCFGSIVEGIAKKYIELRYSLLPHWYSLFYNATQDGLPVMRPLVLEYPEDAETHNLQDQFLIGESILAAPVCFPDVRKRLVYLPKGTWYEYGKNVKHRSGTIIANADLEHMPVYVKAGSIICEQSSIQTTQNNKNTLYTIKIYPGNDTEYTLYQDDGHSNAYKNKEFSLTHFFWDNTRRILTIQVLATNYKDAVQQFRLVCIDQDDAELNVLADISNLKEHTEIKEYTL